MDNLDFVDDDLYSGLIDYWLKEWANLCEKVEKGSVGSKIINLRLLLNDIINEYELNEFKSKNNRLIYIEIINQLLKSKSLAKLRNQLQLLKNTLESTNQKGKHDNENKEKGKKSYEMARDLQLEIDSKLIRTSIFDDIYKVILTKSNTNENREAIKNLTFDLIIDFVTEGVDIKFVRGFLPRFFKKYIVHQGQLIDHYEFVPKELSGEELKKYINDLTLKNRFDEFKSNLVNKKQKYTFVFPLYGISITDSYEILDFEIYPDHEEEEFGFELLILKGIGHDETVKPTVVAKTEIEAISKGSAENIAKKKMGTVIALLNQVPRHGDYEVFTDGQYKLGIDQKLNSSSISDGLGIKEELSKLYSSMDKPLLILENEKEYLQSFTSVFTKLESQKMHKEIGILSDAIRMINNTNKKNNEEALLDYWIILESLASISKSKNDNVVDVIKKFVSDYSIFQLIHGKCNNLIVKIGFYYIKLRDKNQLRGRAAEIIRNIKVDNPVFIPNDFDLDVFFDQLEALKNSIDDYILIDEITSFNRFKDDNQFALKELSKERESSVLTLDYIYKSRNQIVHNGYVDQNIIPHVVNFASNYAHSFLGFVVGSFKNNKFDLPEELLLLEHNAELIESNLKRDNTYMIYK